MSSCRYGLNAGAAAVAHPIGRFRIIRTRTNRQLNTAIQELHDRAESERRWRLTTEQRIERALALLEGQDTDLAARLRAVLQGDQP
ncbi:hypothetical protein FE633_17415 [Streptomyces montanus]|uniref:Uncharacterized protein n=1 Tax=Streptomyces montanus TaxID=2580423 RepID=A0A5R9FZW1_9ACTN|nr:hypothetical protein [Streptomyces montanus]TLS44925.1 hypothetical protein FE633_17415 [Streptomyces montanus]